MPTYSYQCKRCSHIHDVFHGMNAKPAVKCDKCGGPCMKLLGTGAGIIFKGSGFYETDYKKKGKTPSGETAESASKNDGKAATEKPAKPEKKETTAAKSD